MASRKIAKGATQGTRGNEGEQLHGPAESSSRFSAVESPPTRFP